MGWNDHVDWDLAALLGALLDEDYLMEGTPEHGIAQQVLHQGEESMSTKQRFIYDTKIVAAMRAYGNKEERQRIQELLSRDD